MQDGAELQAGEESQGSAIRRRAGERVANVLTKAGVKVNVINEADLPNYIGNERYQELRTSDKVVYGFASGDEVYLVQERMNPDTPIHEYTHLWVEGFAKEHPEEWKKIVDILKKDKVCADVPASEEYANIHNNEQAMASEVMSRLVGEYFGDTDAFGQTRL